MKRIITPNSLKRCPTDEKNLQELSLILASQSKMFEIIRPVFVGFLVSESVGKVWNL